MPSIAIKATTVAVTAATTHGRLTVASNAYLFPGALAWVGLDDGTAQARVKILSVSSTDTVVVRRFTKDDERSPPSYGVSDMSAFNGASHISQEAQTAPIDPAYSKRVVP